VDWRPRWIDLALCGIGTSLVVLAGWVWPHLALLGLGSFLLGMGCRRIL
jgi:hypothetical protein